MKLLKMCALACLLAALCLGVVPNSMSARANESDKLNATEAPTGFDNLTNGHIDQAAFDLAAGVFAEAESIADGIGPVYNALSCVDCHQNPVVGGNSQVLEVRAGKFSRGVFTDHPGGSLIHSRAIHANIQERIADDMLVRTFRASPSILGLGFVEAIPDQTLINIANLQPLQSGGAIRGQVVSVDIVESPGVQRVGRFGWKNQQASLLSFSGDAYVNEMGITTPLFPVENTSNGNSIVAYDPLPIEPDDGDNGDLELFTDFMRSTKAPPRDDELAATPDAQAGAVIFNQIGCAICHTPSITTAPAGTVLNGGAFTVSVALGDKIIHPYSDFAMHDVGTGDGIVQGFPSARSKVRTVPLWGLRTRGRFMHDGATLTMNEAVLRHSGEASFVAFLYRVLSTSDRGKVLTFLRSL